MTTSCDRIRELILDGLSGGMTPDGEREVAEHLAQCAACREFQAAVKQDDEQLAAYAETVSRSVSDLPERVAVALENSAGEIPQPIPLWRKIMRSRISRISTAAAVLIAVVLMGVISGRQSAWAQITEALQKAERVHVTAVFTDSDGKIEKIGLWFEKPNRHREETADNVTVDDGTHRLNLDRMKKTAQLSDSELPAKYYDASKYIDVLKLIKESEAGVTVKLTPLPDEESGAVQVYAAEIASKGEKLTVKGKLWIATDTKLPIRAECEIYGKAEKGHPGALDLTWSYDPIPAEVFSTAIPADYKELPHMPHRALIGRVLDERGAPVAGAIVYASTSYAMVEADSALESRSGAGGNFEIKLPQEDSNRPTSNSQIFVAAFRPDDPDHVAWTLITDPNGDSEESRRIGPMPGDPGRCEVVNGKASPLFGVSGIVLKMEPAGRINGTVTGADGAPVRGAEISAFPGFEIVNGYGSKRFRSLGIQPRGPGSTTTTLATTDAQGRYELRNVPRLWDKVTFLMGVKAAGYVDKVGTFTTNGPLISQEMNFGLYKAALTVTGRAVNDRGEPLVGYEVVPVVEGEAGFLPRESRVTTGADGRFSLPGCPETPELRIRLWADHPPGWRADKPSQSFYPLVESAIQYEAGKTKYDVSLVAETPAITLRVVLKDSAGQLVPYFPVELRHGCLTELWSKCCLRKRTNANGVCVLTSVPRSEGMTLNLSPDNQVPAEFVPALTPEQQKMTAENARFKSVEPPVKLAPERNDETIEVILLTKEESAAQKASQK
jgi:outer membrane lipoprotein-sorting protein